MARRRGWFNRLTLLVVLLSLLVHGALFATVFWLRHRQALATELLPRPGRP